MARFTLQGRDRSGAERHLIYDNETSALLDESGASWPLAYVEREWKLGGIHAVSAASPGTKDSPVTLKIQLGLSCNYACDYCSQRFVPHAGETSKDDVPAFLALLKDSITTPPQRIEFWGGEPLVYIKTLIPLAEALRERYPQASFGLVTNGSLLNPQTNEWLDRLGFGVGISHDGPGQSVRGPDPLDDKQARAGILDLYRRLAPQGRISINAMVHRGNTSREAIARFFLQLTGDPALVIGEGAFVDPYDPGGIAYSLQDDAEAVAFRRLALEEIRRGRLVNLDIARGRMREWARSILERRSAATLGQKCGMDRPDNLAVDLKGNVLTCQNVSHVATAPNGRSHRIGHLGDLKKVQLTTATHWRERADCANCPVLQLCKGACMFLEGTLWEAACDNAYSDHIPFFVAAIEHLTGCAVDRIEGPLPERRRDLFGNVRGDGQSVRSAARKPFPIKVVTV